MNEPKRIPLTDNPRINEPKKLPLYPKTITDDLWERHDIYCGPTIFARKNHENNQQNNTTSIPELESDKID